jgi:hypothetical protein
MTKEIITQDYVKQLFEYRDGVLYWKVTFSGVRQGKKAGTLNNKYYLVQINKKTYRKHRIIFLMHYGFFPDQVDHIDGNTLNNCIENLRAATTFGNNQNRKKSSNNTSGHKGVVWHKGKKKWQVQISVNNKYKCFGSFEDLELADLVAQEARDKYHGAFANHGR